MEENNEDLYLEDPAEDWKKLSQEERIPILNTIAKYYESFNSIVSEIAEEIFSMRREEEIEEVVSIEIVDTTILTTFSYLSEDGICYLTLDFPVSYLTDDQWKAKEQVRTDELLRARRAEIEQRNKELTL